MTVARVHTVWTTSSALSKISVTGSQSGTRAPHPPSVAWSAIASVASASAFRECTDAPYTEEQSFGKDEHQSKWPGPPIGLLEVSRADEKPPTTTVQKLKLPYLAHLVLKPLKYLVRSPAGTQSGQSARHAIRQKVWAKRCQATSSSGSTTMQTTGAKPGSFSCDAEMQSSIAQTN